MNKTAQLTTMAAVAFIAVGCSKKSSSSKKYNTIVPVESFRPASQKAIMAEVEKNENVKTEQNADLAQKTALKATADVSRLNLDGESIAQIEEINKGEGKTGLTVDVAQFEEVSNKDFIQYFNQPSIKASMALTEWQPYSGLTVVEHETMISDTEAINCVYTTYTRSFITKIEGDKVYEFDEDTPINLVDGDDIEYCKQSLGFTNTAMTVYTSKKEMENVSEKDLQGSKVFKMAEGKFLVIDSPPASQFGKPGEYYMYVYLDVSNGSLDYMDGFIVRDGKAVSRLGIVKEKSLAIPADIDGMSGAFNVEVQCDAEAVSEGAKLCSEPFGFGTFDVSQPDFGMSEAERADIQFPADT